MNLNDTDASIRSILNYWSAMEIFKMIMLSWALCPVLSTLPRAQQGGFPAQAARVLRRVRLPPRRLRAAPRVLRDLRRLLHHHWPGSQFTPFGAIVTGLGMWDSDVDCFVMLPNRSRVSETIFEAQRIFDQHPRLFRRPTAVLVAKEPHVRLIHAPTGHQCDVSFGSLSAVRNTALLSYLMRVDRRAMDLTTILKYWSKVHKPPGVRRIMPNYAMISLVIFYLQQVQMLPPIAYLQQNAQRYIVDDWETGFNEMSYRFSNNDTLLELLGGFFKYYDNFDFEDTIVSPFTGVVMRRNVFKYVDTVHDEFSLYKRNVGKNGHEPLNIKTAICVQDAFKHNSNLAEDTSPEVFLQFKTDLKYAAEAFVKTRNDFLKLILEDSKVLQELTHHKQTLVNNWSNVTSESCWEACV